MFQSRQRIAVSMGLGIRSSVVLLLMLLSTCVAPAVPAQPSADIEVHEDAGWHRMSPSEMVSVDLKESTGILRTTLGSFDPLNSPAPESSVASHASDSVFIIQLQSADAMILAGLADEYSLRILDHLPDEGWVIRTDSSERIALLEQEPEVRWIGQLQSAWKMSESLQQQFVQPPAFIDIAVVLTPDLKQSVEMQMSAEFSALGVERSWCGNGQCELWGLSWDAEYLEALATDDRILHLSTLQKSEALNSHAGETVGSDTVALMANGLDGTGEVIGISDTGIDSDHPDFGQSILSIKTNYGLDSSSLDTNGGHGTHVVGSVIGSGTGDAEATGLAPGALLHFQALEHDNSGYFGRQGSLYDLLRDFYISGARTGSNSWGAPGAQGQYTSDARSVDAFADDYEDFTVLFAAGESSSGIASPSTAKNVLSIGASTSNRTGSLPAGSVWSSSANGFSADGRIKPDLVAPGVDICSTMSEDALNPIGVPCASGTHSNGDAMYGQSNGSSHSTAVAAASVLLTREFLRNEAMVSAPSADLVRATLINGAEDLGVADIPNAQEGWGQIDLVESMYPMDGTTALKTFYDSNISLRPGFGFIYGFDFDISHGVSITLVWTDREGSSSAAQSAPRLVNDLDLILTAPDGTTWFGNDFANGVSATNGVTDSVNVIERIELPAGTSSQSGSWSVQVAHRGGMEQSFAIVVTADGVHDPATDLAVFSDSITPSSTDPLVNELLSITTSWINQAPLAASSYKVKLEDVTSGDVLSEITKQGTQGGEVVSSSIYHTFSTTGSHLLRLTLDVDDDVAEINDENNGFNNNVKEFTVNVTALGVRLIPLFEDGSEPTTNEQTEVALTRMLDARNDSTVSFDVILRHEGTGTEMVTLSAGSVKMLDPDNGVSLISSPDVWTRSLNVTSPLELAPAGSEGDEKAFTIELVDTDADPDADVPRYAYAGHYVIDIEARYQMQPLVRHKIRLTLQVEEVDDVDVAIAGTTGLAAQPGQVADFSVSVRNMGNNPATYKVECVSENRWQIELGDGTSSSQVFEPLGLLEYLPMQVRVRIPEADSGNPAAGSSDSVDCWVTSVDDDSLNYSLTVDVGVSALNSFDVLMVNPSGEQVGAAALAPEVSVDAGLQYNHTLEIENIGNTELELIVSIQTTSTTWPVFLFHADESSANQLEIVLDAGSNTTVRVAAGVPGTSQEGDSNALVIFTYMKGTNKNLGIKNSTTLQVRKDVGIEFNCFSNTGADSEEGNQVFMEATIGSSSTLNCTVRNTGNAFLSLVWSSSTVNGWEMGFASPPQNLDSYDEMSFFFLAMAPEGGEDGSLLVTLRVVASHSNQTVDSTVSVSMIAADSAFAMVTSMHEEDYNLLGSDVGKNSIIKMTVKNIGNKGGTWIPTGTAQGADGNSSDNWDIECDDKDGLTLDAGESKEISCSFRPLDDTDRTVLDVRIVMVPVDSTHHVGSDDGLTMQASVERDIESSGLFAGMSTKTVGISVLIVSILLVIVGIRVRRVNRGVDEGEMLIAPGSFAAPDSGDRRTQALDIGNKANEIASGSVNEAEVAAAIAQASPILPPVGISPLHEKKSKRSSKSSGGLPVGLPPVLPKGLPPLPAPPAPVTPAAPAVAPTVAPPATDFDIPPLPPGGLPAGWTMEQWKHYGMEWLKRQG